MAGIVGDRLELQDFWIGGDEGAEVLPGGCSATTGLGSNLSRGKPRPAMVVLRIRAVRAAVAACPLLRLWTRRWSHSASTGAHAGTLPPCPNALAFSRLFVHRSVHSGPDGAVYFARACTQRAVLAGNRRSRTSSGRDWSTPSRTASAPTCDCPGWCQCPGRSRVNCFTIAAALHRNAQGPPTAAARGCRTMDAAATTRSPAPMSAWTVKPSGSFRLRRSGPRKSRPARERSHPQPARYCAAISDPRCGHAHLVPDSGHGQPAVEGARQMQELGPVLMVDEGTTFFAGRAKDPGTRCWLARHSIFPEHVLERGGFEDFERPHLQLSLGRASAGDVRPDGSIRPAPGAGCRTADPAAAGETARQLDGFRQARHSSRSG